MYWIKITNQNDTFILINPTHIIAIQENPNTVGSIITVIGGTDYYAKETLDELVIKSSIGSYLAKFSSKQTNHDTTKNTLQDG